jgi:hypothetical protein
LTRRRTHACLAATLMLLRGIVALGNDGAASSGAGGIQLRHEANISMEKERLTIGESKVTVEYEFLNDTDKDITTEVAFPIPPYENKADDPGGIPDFNDFHLWVDGKELKYNTDVRAKTNGKDYTDILKPLGVDIASFDGTYGSQGDPPKGAISRLPKKQVQQLANLGLIDSADGTPRWEVVKAYYWTQTFPAHKILHVRHEYTPMVGYESISPEDLAFNKPHPNDPQGEIDRVCVDPSLQKGLADRAIKNYKPTGTLLGMAWVGYILTTANTWKTPIKDFTLVIDRTKGISTASFGTRYVSLCWDGPINKLDADHLVANKTNFIPQKELNVAFISFSGPPDK